jgi:hypothetical protein
MAVVTRYRSENGLFYGYVETFRICPAGGTYNIVANYAAFGDHNVYIKMATCKTEAEAIEKLDAIQSIDGLASQVDLRDHAGKWEISLPDLHA